MTPSNAQELLPIVVQNQTALVDARLLHQNLKSGQKYADWIKKRITEYSFEENKDFFSSENSEIKKGRGGDRRSLNLLITLDMAKELAMVERNDVGRAIRRYFIEKEKELRAVSQLPRQAEVLRGLKVSRVNGRRLVNYRAILERCGYSLKTGGIRKQRYPGHFVVVGRELLVTEEFALHLYHQKQVTNNRQVLRNMQPVLPFTFGQAMEPKGGAQ